MTNTKIKHPEPNVVNTNLLLNSVIFTSASFRSTESPFPTGGGGEGSIVIAQDDHDDDVFGGGTANR